MWGTSPSDVYAVGFRGTILHYDGTGWSSMVSGTPWELWDVWGTSATDVYAVGYLGTILHYDGTVWSDLAIYNQLGPTHRGIWGTSSGLVYIVATGETILRGSR